MSAYEDLGIVDDDDIPGWERTPPKWTALIDEIYNLEPGQTKKLFFEDKDEANRARNAVRDGVNLKARAGVCRTRVVVTHEGAYVWLTRTEPQHQKEETE